jgi:hypothetical protein
MCMCVRFSIKREGDSRIKPGEGVRYEKMDGCKIYIVNVESLFV